MLPEGSYLGSSHVMPAYLSFLNRSRCAHVYKMFQTLASLSILPTFDYLVSIFLINRLISFSSRSFPQCNIDYKSSRDLLSQAETRCINHCSTQIIAANKIAASIGVNNTFA